MTRIFTKISSNLKVTTNTSRKEALVKKVLTFILMALGVCFTVNAQKMETDPIRDSKVLDTTTAKKGQGCIKMTRGTWMPLDAKKCDDLFSKNERLKVVFVSPNGKVKIYDPIIKIDEKWYLYEDEKGKLTWKIPKK